MRRVLSLISFVFLISIVAAAQGATKVETIGELTAPDVPDAIKKAVGDKGYRVTLDDGAIAGELWFRKEVSKNAGGDGDLARATFVGVAVFPAGTSDFRGQPIKAGAYTMRFELLPNDGNHMGAAPSRDFLVLSPVAADTDPDAAPPYPALMAMSRRASGTQHPATLWLDAAAADAPSVSANDHGHTVFTIKLKLKDGGELPLGIVVKGQAEQ